MHILNQEQQYNDIMLQS